MNPLPLFGRPTALLAMGAMIALSLTLLSEPEGARADVTIPVGDLWFCNSSFQNGVCETLVNQGETVTWNYASGVTLHNSRECGADCSAPSGSPVWQLPAAPTAAPWTQSFTFSTPGTYLYRCDLHTVAMRGRIVVQAPQSVGGIAELPDAAGSPSRNYGILAALGAGVVLVGSAGAWYARRQFRRG